MMNAQAPLHIEKKPANINQNKIRLLRINFKIL